MSPLPSLFLPPPLFYTHARTLSLALETHIHLLALSFTSLSFSRSRTQSHAHAHFLFRSHAPSRSFFLSISSFTQQQRITA